MTTAYNFFLSVGLPDLNTGTITAAFHATVNVSDLKDKSKIYLKKVGSMLQKPYRIKRGMASRPVDSSGVSFRTASIISEISTSSAAIASPELHVVWKVSILGDSDEKVELKNSQNFIATSGGE